MNITDIKKNLPLPLPLLSVNESLTTLNVQSVTAAPLRCIRVFHIRTEMPIVTFSSLLGEKKNESSDKMISLVGIEPGPSDSMLDLE